MITTSIKYFKENVYIPKLRIPNQNIEFKDYKNIDYNDIIIKELGDDGNLILHMGIILPNDNAVNNGITFDIQLIKDELYHPHLEIARVLQKQGLGYKILLKFIKEFGHIYVTEARTLNKKEIPTIINKLKNESFIEHYKTNIGGELFVLNTNPDKNYLLDKYTDNIQENIKLYYSTSIPISISHFIELEVEERENYDIDEVNEWINKYNINDSTKLIWVSDKPYIAARYSMPAENWDNAEEIYNRNKNNYELNTYTSNDGIIIQESNDGDDGYLMILNK